MGNLERLVEAFENFRESNLYHEDIIRRWPWMDYMMGFIGTEAILGIINGPDEKDPSKFTLYTEPVFAVAAASYLGMAFAYEIMDRKRATGDEPRFGMLAEATGIAALVSGAETLAGNYTEAAVAGSIMLPFSKNASNAYFEAEINAPLKNRPLSERITHNFWFAYPEAVAIAGAVAIAALSPFLPNPSGLDGLNETLYNGTIAGASLFIARGAIGGFINNIANGYYSLLAAGTPNKKELLEYAKKRLEMAKGGADTIARLERLAEAQILNDDYLAGLQSYEQAAMLADSPFFHISAQRAKFQRGRKSLALEDEVKVFSSQDIELLRQARSNHTYYRHFEIAEAYAERISELTDGNNPDDEWAHVLSLSILKRYDDARAKLQSYIKAVLPKLKETAQTESVSESRNDVWKVAGGYLRRMEPARAESEYRNAMLFFEHFKGRMPEPVPPIEIGGQSYVFSRAFGEGNLLDKIRSGMAKPQDMIGAIDLLVETQRIGASISDLLNPLDDEGYLIRRLETVFLESLRRNGIEVPQDQEAILRRAVNLLEPSIRALHRGIYHDQNPKNVVEGPAGLKIPIDWEELTRYPLQKDVYKLVLFGDFYIPTNLYNQLIGQVLRGTHEFVAPEISFGDYLREFQRGLYVMGPSIHLDMAGYASKDEASSNEPYLSAWNRDAQRFHIWYASSLFNDVYRFAERFGIEQDEIFLEAADVLSSIIDDNFPQKSTFTPQIPDVRRPFFRGLLRKEERYSFI